MSKISEEEKYSSEMQKCQYYCPNCGHTMTFVLNVESKLCKYCRVKIKKPKKSLYDLKQEKFYKRKYLEFLKKKEGI